MVARLTLFFIMTVVSGWADQHREPISIIVPRPDGSRVPGKTCVSGHTRGTEEDLVIVVHPAGGQYFVQPRPLIDPDGHFRAEIYVGEEGLGKDANLPFQIGVFAGPPNAQKLTAGQILDAWPAARARSRLVTVVRDDSAANGCMAEDGIISKPTLTADGALNLQLNDSATRNLQRVDHAISPQSATNTTQPVAGSEEVRAREPEVRSPFSLIGREAIRKAVGLGLMLALCVAVSPFISLAAFPRRAAVGAIRIIGWVTPYRMWLVRCSKHLLTTICSLWSWLQTRCVSWSSGVWSERGFQGNFRQFGISLLLAPLLGAAGFAAFGSDAKVLLKGLDALYGIEEQNSSSAPASGAFAEGPEINDSVENKISPKLPLRSRALAMVATSLVEYLESFLDVIRAPMGFLASALAFLQATLGIALFWKLDRTEVSEVGIRWRRMSRLILSVIFVLFTCTLSAIAAIRGHDLSQTDWPICSMIVSALIALLMPWVIIVTWHFAIESAADLLGPFQSIIVVAGMTGTAAAVIATWTVCCLIVISALGIGFTLSSAFCFLLSALLRIAELEGDFAYKIVQRLRPNDRVGRTVAAVPVGVTVGLLVTAYFLVGRILQ